MIKASASAEVPWDVIHDSKNSWRTKLIGNISQAYVIPRYLELIEKTFRGCSRLSFLELGSGNGDLTEVVLKNKFPFIGNYLASESFQAGVEWLQSKGISAVKIDAEKIDFGDASFDVVVSFDVMHHVKNPAQMGREMLRAGRGKLLLTESNGLSLGRKLMELTPGHRRAGEQSYTPREYRNFFKHAGYEITKFEIAPFIFPLKLPAWGMNFAIAFNRWIERMPLLKWQCSNVHIYIEYNRTCPQ